MNDAAQAEEVVQTVFARVWQNRADLRIASSGRAYLYAAVRNGALNRLVRTCACGRHDLRGNVDLRAGLAWLDGRLAFDDAPLALVLPRLARRFDVQFRLEDPALAQRRVTASFDAPTLDRILDALSLALSIRFEARGGVIVVSAGE